MRKHFGKNSFWLGMGLLASRAALAQTAPSYFGTTTPPAGEVVELKPAAGPNSIPVPPPRAPAPIKAPELKNITDGQPPRSADETKLDEALGATEGYSDALEEKFRRYLSAQPLRAGKTATYPQELNRVRILLQDRKTLEAWSALQAMANDYDLVDAHASRDLASWVKSVLNLNKDLHGLDAKDEQTRGLEVRATGQANVLKETAAQEGKATRLPNSKPTMPAVKATPPARIVATENSEIEKKLALKLEELKAAEARQHIEQDQSKAQESLSQSEARFATLVNQFYAEGKFEQAALGLPFYEQLFKGERCPAEVAGKVAEADATSRQIGALLQLAAVKLKAKQVAAAAGDLRKAFANSDCHSSLIDLDANARTRIGTYIALADQLRRCVEHRELSQAVKRMDSIKQAAPDFDPAKLLALVRAYQAESGFQLNRADQAWRARNLEAAQEAWWAAKKTWCDNPALNDFPEAVRAASDTPRKTLEFEQLLAAKNFRKIFDQRQRFADLFVGDALRSNQLQTAVESIQVLDIALSKIENMRRAGDIYGAWELADATAKERPEDASAHDWLVRLAQEGADYVGTIQRARDAEAQRAFGYSLAWYVAAQQLYPTSQLASEGIARLRPLLFPPDESRTFVLASSNGGKP